MKQLTFYGRDNYHRPVVTVVAIVRDGFVGVGVSKFNPEDKVLNKARGRDIAASRAALVFEGVKSYSEWSNPMNYKFEQFQDNIKNQEEFIDIIHSIEARYFRGSRNEYVTFYEFADTLVDEIIDFLIWQES